MIYLLLSIIFATSLFIIFKYFEIYKIDTFQAIITNYVVAFLIGIAHADAFHLLPSLHVQEWFYGTIFLGFLFVTIFFVMAKTSQINGVSVASIAGKMSLVVPVIFGIIVYKESYSFWKIIGIIIALAAVYFSSIKEEGKKNNFKKSFLLPLLLFLGSGAVDTTLKYLETNYVAENDLSFFSGSIFLIAALMGISVLIFKYFYYGSTIKLRNIIAGVILGIPNYFSILFLLKAFQIEHFESSTLFTINNVGVVLLSSIMGFFLFKEKFSLKNKIGVLLAIVGIILVAVA